MFGKRKHAIDDPHDSRGDTHSVSEHDTPASPATTAGEGTVIGESLELHGDIVSEGPVSIDGRVQGTVKAAAVLVGARGVVTGTITCESLTVRGRFQGDAACSNFTVAADALVHANVRYRTLNAQRGAVIVGELHPS